MRWTVGMMMLVNGKWNKIWFLFTSWNAREDRVHKHKGRSCYLHFPPPKWWKGSHTLSNTTMKQRCGWSIRHCIASHVYLSHSVSTGRKNCYLLTKLFLLFTREHFVQCFTFKKKTRKWVEKYVHKTWRLVSKVIDLKLISHGLQVPVS